jgi:sulfoxide reductase heme-binding subunit YedZ
LISFAAVSSNWYWYFGRATGFVSLFLLTAILVLGIVGTLRVVSDRWPRFAIGTLHRDLALLSVAVIAIHIFVAVMDKYVPVPLSAAVLPFGAGYRPLWMGLGALSLDLMLALIFTSLIRRRLGHKPWRMIHWLAYVSWPVAVAHGIGAGSDSTSAWALGLTIACCLVVAAAVAVRIRHALPQRRARHEPGIRLSSEALR